MRRASFPVVALGAHARPACKAPPSRRYPALPELGPQDPFHAAGALRRRHPSPPRHRSTLGDRRAVRERGDRSKVLDDRGRVEACRSNVRVAPELPSPLWSAPTRCRERHSPSRSGPYVARSHRQSLCRCFTWLATEPLARLRCRLPGSSSRAPTSGGRPSDRPGVLRSSCAGTPPAPLSLNRFFELAMESAEEHWQAREVGSDGEQPKEKCGYSGCGRDSGDDWHPQKATHLARAECVDAG